MGSKAERGDTAEEATADARIRAGRGPGLRRYPPTPVEIYADAHVHVYGCFDRARLLAAARARAEALGGPLLLLLTETARDDAFRALQGEGTLAGTAEGRALRLPGSSLGPFLIAGRQFVSSEGIEVLGLALAPDHPLFAEVDRQRSVEELVSRVLGAGAAAVLPWGLGKWIGPRGARVAGVAGSERFAREPLFFLGDVAQRCWPWPRPRLFGGPVRVLPGSDPLPVPGAERRVGGYGFGVEGDFDPERPAASLLEALRGSGEIRAVGRRETLRSTAVEQVRYRLQRARA